MSRLHGLPSHNLDGDVVPNGGHLLEEDDCPVPDRPAQAARACSGTEQLPAEPLQGALEEATCSETHCARASARALR